MTAYKTCPLLTNVVAVQLLLLLLLAFCSPPNADAKITAPTSADFPSILSELTVSCGTPIHKGESRFLVRQNPWSSFDPDGLSQKYPWYQGGFVRSNTEAVLGWVEDGVVNVGLGAIQGLAWAADQGHNVLQGNWSGFGSLNYNKGMVEGLERCKNPWGRRGYYEMEGIHRESLRDARDIAAGLLIGSKAGRVEKTASKVAEETAETVEKVSPKSLVSRQGPSEMTENKVKKLTKDMKENGFDQAHPIDVAEVDGKKIILDGHHRAKAAARAGIEEVPVKVNPVTSEQADKLAREAAEAAAERAARQR